MQIEIADFQRMQLRVGRIKKAEAHPDGDRLLVLEVDLGQGGDAPDIRQMVAGVKPYYAPEELVDKQVVVVANLQPATIRGVESNGMVLAALDGETLSLVTTDRPVREGAQVE